MFIGIIVFALLVYLASSLISKISNGFSHQNPATACMIVLTAVVCMGVIPAIGMHYFEYPTLFGKPTVATFDKDDNLVYHKWGLYTPPGREVVNVHQKRVWNLTSPGTPPTFVVDKNGELYQLEVEIKVSYENPKVFFSAMDRRNQSTNPALLSPEIRLIVWRSIIGNHDSLSETFSLSCEIKKDPLFVPPCPALDKKVEGFFPVDYYKIVHGVKVQLAVSGYQLIM